MHLPINIKSPNNISKWQVGFNSAFKGLTQLENLNYRMAGIACFYDYLHRSGAGEVAVAARRFVFTSFFLHFSISAFALLEYYH
jgi:hypothetical protein